MSPENFEEQHGGFGYGINKKKRERILEFFAAVNSIAGNTLSKKTASLFVIYESSPSKTQVDYRLVWRSQRSFLKDVKILPSKECITKHKPLLYDFKIRKVKGTKRNFLPKRKI